MIGNTQYRFLPWARRGIASAIETPDDGGALPQRAQAQVGITISNVNPAGVDLALYGPGDVLGIDTRLIVRTTPVANSTNTEPNYFAAIDFDPPDFVWLFTPARGNAAHRLRPWLVLIVLDRSLIDAPRVERNHLLPSINIPGELVKQELPDLSESWAWAHSQVMTGQGPVDELDKTLKEQPEFNVSRLMCPRHLEPNKRYLACLVPAFDAGVIRGLGGKPDPDSPLGPAWSLDIASDKKLPVYFHWEFATGPLGDFESLARKLKPFASPQSVGVTSMYVGDASPGLPFVAPLLEDGSVNPAAVIEMDGALRAPKRSTGSLDDITTALKNALEDVLNAPAKLLAEGPSDATPALGPPVYGQWQSKQHTVSNESEGWIHELNLDPRTRTAAGLGAEVVKKFQEEFMQACWRQVEDVLAANNRLGWARLSLEVNRCTYKRHYQVLRQDRFFQLTAPLHRRTLNINRTIKASVDVSSMPDAMSDSSFRRLLSPQRALVKKTARRLLQQNRLSPTFMSKMQSSLLTNTAAGDFRVDPNRFVPDGLVHSVLIDQIINGEVSDVAGVNVTLQQAETLKAQVNNLSNRDYQTVPLQVVPRNNLRSHGLVTTNQIDAMRLLEAEPETSAFSLNYFSASSQFLGVASSNKGAHGIYFSIGTGGSASWPILLAQSGNVLLIGQGNPLPLGTIDTATFGEQIDYAKLMYALPSNTFDGLGSSQTSIFLNSLGLLNIKNSLKGTNLSIPYHSLIDRTGNPFPLNPNFPPVTNPLPLPGQNLPNKTLPMPEYNLDEIQAFEDLVQSNFGEEGLNQQVQFGELRSFSLGSLSTNLLGRIKPDQIVANRLRELINLKNGDLWSTVLTDPTRGVHLTPQKDRVLAYPEIPRPMYEFLAEYSQEHFCPGIGLIPPNSITLLETNPRFIESFMVGLNYEMNRELLWREYPSDQRGTTFQYFWDWVNDLPDIEPIHTWLPETELGNNTRGAGEGGQTVMLVKGELVLRYPNLVLMAWKADQDGTRLKDPPTETDIRLPVFQGKLKPDVAFAGFDLVDTELTADGGWFFLIQEQPTEPRFGLDVGSGGNPDALTSWHDASWLHAETAPGKHLKLSQAGALTDQTFDALTFGKNSAHMASITLQKPMRIAMHARTIVEE